MSIQIAGEQSPKKPKNNRHVKKIIIGVCGAVLVLTGIGCFVTYQNMQNTKHDQVKFEKVSKKYKKIGKDLSKEDYYKIEKAGPLVEVNKDASKDIKTSEDKPKSEVQVEKGTNDVADTTIGRDSQSTLRDIQSNIKGEDGKSPNYTEEDLAKAVLVQYTGWNSMINSDLGWGKANYPDKAYDANRENISQLIGYAQGGDKPKTNMYETSFEEQKGMVKASIYNGTQFGSWNENANDGYKDVLNNYLTEKLDNKFTSINSIFVTKEEKNFDGSESNVKALINTNGGTYYAYITIMADNIKVLDISNN